VSQPADDATEPRFQRLFPEPRSVSVADVLDELNVIGAAGPERPLTMVNFVASVDGRAALGGRSAPLSDPGDRAMFHGLRERVDAVFAGTGTMRAEGYGRLVRDPARRRRRAARGLAPDPLACVISRSGNIPTEIPLFADSHSRVIVFSSHAPDLAGAAAHVESVVLDRGELTLTTMMRRLRAAYDVRALLCEGGPTVFSGMLHEGLVDELFLTCSPSLAGGGSDPTLTSGPGLPEPLGLTLRWVLEREGTLFLRYCRA
jgi:riboflavin-specific deaminase-like protein